MKKFFLFCISVVAAMTLSAKEISTVELNVLWFPTEGALVYSACDCVNDPYLYTGEAYIAVESGDDDSYRMQSYDFYDGEGNCFTNGTRQALQPNTTYRVCMTIISYEDPFSANPTILINGQAPLSWSKVDDQEIKCTVAFVPEVYVGIDRVAESQKASKHIVNGQLVIIRNGRTFNALGAEIK